MAYELVTPQQLVLELLTLKQMAYELVTPE